MFRLLCSCLAAALLLVTFGGIDARATEGVIEQVYVATAAVAPEAASAEPAGEPEETGDAADADESETGVAERAATGTSGNETPDVEELIRKAILKAFAPSGQQVEIEKKVVVDLMDLEGKSRSDALNLLKGANLKAVEAYDYSDDVPAGYVISQHPKKGTPVEADSDVQLVIAQRKVAVEPFKFRLDMVNPETWAQMLVHRPFDVQRGPGGNHRIRHLPMFSIAFDGENMNVANTNYDLLEARAISIAENLLMAWKLMDEGAKLTLVPDQSIDANAWHTRPPYDSPDYLPSDDSGGSDTASSAQRVHINVENGSVTLRVMTVYPQDAKLYGSPHYSSGQGDPADRGRLSSQEAAEYIAALINVHHLLFSKRAMDFGAFDELDIDNTRVGELLQDVRDKAERLVEQGVPVRESLQRALASFSRSPQADLLYSFASAVPIEWRVREEHGKTADK